MKPDVVIIGAGAAGLMCAISAAHRGHSVVVLDHANKAGKKILISGGGRCNFTNMYIEPANYLSNNPHFCKSALNRYTQWDFIAKVDKAQLPWHEKKLGQLFSDNESRAILSMLLDECQELGVKIELNYHIENIEKKDTTFFIATSQHTLETDSLVIATGAMSFPTMGATDFGHKLARQFGLKVTHTTPGLVPFTLEASLKTQFVELAGISVDANVQCNEQSFRENILFTHKGLSGPAILQISSYWRSGDKVEICMLPDLDLANELKNTQKTQPKKQLSNILQQFFPQRVVNAVCAHENLTNPMQQYKHKELQEIADLFQKWIVIPSGTEGYKKAEVTLGGVNTDEISSKTFESKKVSGLYFIGEVLDVTGHLGGFNFQWAWASGYCCGQSV